MYTSPNMLLEVWDLGDDDFDYGVLASNLRLIDQHDHSPAHGRQINGGVGILASSITQTQMASLSIGNPQLQPNSVAQQQLQTASVGTSQLQLGSVVAGPIPNGAITAPLLDPTLIPLGFVTQWWRPPQSQAVPGGFWEIMDGRPWNQITNAWGLTQGSIPDLRGKFAQGADLTTSYGPPVGATGGSSSAGLAHTHRTLGHNHTIGPHAHNINPDGSHIHLWQGGLHMWARTNAFDIGTVIVGAYGGYHANTFYSTYIKGLASNPAWGQANIVQPGIPGVQQQLLDGAADMDSAGYHSHGGVTSYDGATTTSTSSEGTDGGTLGNVSTIPPYVGLSYIMRVR